jgi:hypothetical protein
LTDLAVTEATDDVMMTEAVEEMTAETTDVIIKETSAEIIDVAVIEIIVLGGMTAEILMETMIGIVQNATIPTLLEELNVIDVVLQSRVVDTLVIEETLGMILAHQEGIIDEILETEITIDQSARRLLTMIGNAKNVITTIFRLEPNVIDAENQNQAEEEITETVDHTEMTGLEEIEVHAESVEQEATTVQVEIVVEVIEVADRVMNEGGVESEIQMLPNSAAPEANHRVMPTTEDHNPSMLVL